MLLSRFFVEICLHHISNDRGRLRAMAAIFKQGDDHNFGRFAGREAHEPRIVLHCRADFLLFKNVFEASWAVPVFPQTLSPGMLCSGGRSSFVYNAVHSIDDFLNVVELQVGWRAGGRFGSVFDQCGGNPNTAGRDPTDRRRELEGRHRYGTLPDRYRNRLTGIPFAPEIPVTQRVDGITPSASCGRSIPVR